MTNSTEKFIEGLGTLGSIKDIIKRVCTQHLKLKMQLENNRIKFYPESHAFSGEIIEGQGIFDWDQVTAVIYEEINYLKVSLLTSQWRYSNKPEDGWKHEIEKEIEKLLRMIVN